MSQRDFAILLSPFLLLLALCTGVVAMDAWRSLRGASQPATAPGPVIDDDAGLPARVTPDRPIGEGAVTGDATPDHPIGNGARAAAEVTGHRPIGDRTGVETGATPHRPTSGGPAISFPLPVPAMPRSPAKPGDSLFDRVGVREIAGDVYAVTGADVWSALQDPERVLAEAAPDVRLIVSPDSWPRFAISSQAVDGVLTSQGFIVTDPKHAQRAGIQMGDTIVGVNGHRVDGLASLYSISRNVRQTGAQSAIRVYIQRQGSLLTKTYALQ